MKNTLMIIDKELIDILKVDCTGLNINQSAFKQAKHIDYIFMCLGIINNKNTALQQINSNFKQIAANEAYKVFLRKYPEYSKTSIEVLNLKPRSICNLRCYGINTIAELLMLTKYDIMRMRNLSIVSLNDIIDKLHKYNNLQLRIWELY